MNQTKIIIRNEHNQKIIEYESNHIPMMYDEIDLPKHLGVVKVVERIFFVDKPDEVILKVRR